MLTKLAMYDAPQINTCMVKNGIVLARIRGI